MGVSELLEGGGGKSTAPMTATEEYEGNVIFGNSEGFVKLLGDSGVSEHYLYYPPDSGSDVPTTYG